jgi:hypothetical protein
MGPIIRSAGYLLLGRMAACCFFWPLSNPITIRFEGIHKATARSGGRTISYAEFEIRNVGARTVYYEGTPYPVYVIEHLKNGRWIRNEAEVDAENFAALFPGHRFRFKLVAPAFGTNQWRLGIRWIRPNYAPVTLRRFFPARSSILFSDALEPFAPQSPVEYTANTSTKSIPAAVP